MKTSLKNFIFVLFLAVSFFVLTSESTAREKDGDVNQQNTTYLAKQTEGHGGIVGWMNINGISSYFNWDGVTGHNIQTGSSGTLYPRSTGVGVIYRDGLVWGGLVRDDTTTQVKRVGGNTYRIGTQPGLILPNGEAEDWANQTGTAVRLYRIRGDFRTMSDADLAADAADIYTLGITSVTETEIAAVKAQYGLDWAEWPTDRDAPYYDVDNDGTYNPILDDDGWAIIPGTVDADKNPVAYNDFPGYANGDQVIWTVINDLNSGRTVSLYGSQPIGIQLETTAWGYNISSEAPLGNVFFKRYRVINRSGFTLDSLYFAQWSDPDLGDYSDDYVGVDSTESMMYAYNGDDYDADFGSFGLAPGACGYDFLQGPIVDAPGDSAIFNGQLIYDKKNLAASSFSYFTAGGNPASDPTLGDYSGTKEWYNMLRGGLPTDDDEIQGYYTTPEGDDTFFPLAGKPWVVGENNIDGWIEGPADRRMSIATGPISMVDGEVQEVVVGVIGALSVTQLASAQKVLFYDQAVQEAYNAGFDIAKPPVAPNVTASTFEDYILLDWGADAAVVGQTEVSVGAYDFEGYNVYQFTQVGEPVKIATFDISNGIQTITQLAFDDESGVILEKAVQTGKDAGVQRYITIDRDYADGGALSPGHTYTFAVTAYNYTTDVTLLTKSLENSFTQLPVVHQGEKPGEDFDTATLSDVTHTVGATTGTFDVIVRDPAGMKDMSYTAYISKKVDYTSGGIDKQESYYTVVSSAGDTVLKDFQNIAYVGETLAERDAAKTLKTWKGSDSPTFDGIVTSADLPIEAGPASWDYSGNRWVSGTDFGGPFLFGGGFAGMDFFGSTLTYADLWQCEMLFQDQADVDANGYRTQGRNIDRDAGYTDAGIGDVPFEAFDINDPANPRKVDIIFCEDDRYSPANNLWDMGWDGSAFADQGSREYLFIMDGDYSGGVNYAGVDVFDTDCVWAIGPSARGSHPYLEAIFTMWFYANLLPQVDVDTWTFSTTAPTTGNKKLAEDQFDKATVWPNPYYAYNTQELSSTSRFVTLSNLPEKVSVRIFNLAGTQVRKLEKDDTDQFLRWDLANEAGLPVSSGLYVYYIDAPGLGKTKVLKGFIIQAKQKLRYF